jgi:hypothetical protein
MHDDGRTVGEGDEEGAGVKHKRQNAYYYGYGALHREKVIDEEHPDTI